jgi:dihydropteroate synthase
MGVVNVTPDSFSDGGRFFEPAAAVDRVYELVEQGAEVIDIGAESSRPQALPITEQEELHRLEPVLAKLSGRLKIPISIDTMKVGVAGEALAAGASIINDVGANREDSEMWELVADTGAAYICLHMQGTPRTMQENPIYGDVVLEVEEFFKSRFDRMRRCGVQPNQIIFDPGIGFGKKIEHNLKLMAGLERFARLDRPLLLGVSRKSFLGKISGQKPEQRLAPGLACACLAVEAGVQLIRTHDVAETVQAIRMTEAIMAQRRE